VSDREPTAVYMTAPDKNGTPSLPKRGGPRGLLPSTWLERTLRVQYVDGFGVGQETSGTLLDLFPAGPVLNIKGAKTCLSWDRLVLCELVDEDPRGDGPLPCARRATSKKGAYLDEPLLRN
jgi:hypothetical protein